MITHSQIPRPDDSDRSRVREAAYDTHSHAIATALSRQSSNPPMVHPYGAGFCVRINTPTLSGSIRDLDNHSRLREFATFAEAHAVAVQVFGS